ncbi:MAG TPA: hypothetical protein VK846_12190 [Candidatus Limnocylindria bacterium]|nr:hypothetical protein [Candidatus Limnocylindria bacterium]
MPPEQGLSDLRRRKKELLLESDINRQILQLECCQLRLKATEWRQGLLKARTLYTWLTPAAAIAFGVFSMRKRMRAHDGNGHHNGRGSRKSAYIKLLAPLAFAALRKAYTFWRYTRRRNASVA